MPNTTAIFYFTECPLLRILQIHVHDNKVAGKQPGKILIGCLLTNKWRLFNCCKNAILYNLDGYLRSLYLQLNYTPTDTPEQSTTLSVIEQWNNLTLRYNLRIAVEKVAASFFTSEISAWMIYDYAFFAIIS